MMFLYVLTQLQCNTSPKFQNWLSN